jgi:hypothetical protein
MQLGGLPKIGQAETREIQTTDLDFTVLDKKVQQVKQLQVITIIALVFIVLLLLRNGKN